MTSSSTQTNITASRPCASERSCPDRLTIKGDWGVALRQVAKHQTCQTIYYRERLPAPAYFSLQAKRPQQKALPAACSPRYRVARPFLSSNGKTRTLAQSQGHPTQNQRLNGRPPGCGKSGKTRDPH